MRTHLPAFVQHLAARAAAPRTIESYKRTVRQFLDQLEERPSTSTEIEAFLARPCRDGKPRGASTKRAELMALRAFFRFVARDGAVIDPTHGITVKRERREAAPVAMPADVPLLFEAAARSSAPARNVAVLGVLHVLGLRVHELAGLDIEQVDLAAKMLRRVRGKGGVVVDFPLPEALVAILERWLTERAMAGHAVEAGPLFPTARRRIARPSSASRSSCRTADCAAGQACYWNSMRDGSQCATTGTSTGSCTRSSGLHAGLRVPRVHV
jgi:site-specific recombinase XerD